MSPSDITTIKKPLEYKTKKKVQMPNKQKKKIFTQKSVGKGGLVGEQLKFVGGVYKTLKATR